MASTSTTHNHGAPFPFLKLPSELRNRVYHFTIPPIIRPHRSPPNGAFEFKSTRKLSIALLLINKQTHDEISHVLYQYSHFLITVNPERNFRAIQSSIFWKRYQYEWKSVKQVRRIKHIDIDFAWAQHRAGLSDFSYLKYDFEVLRVFPRLQTLTLRCKKYGDMNSHAMVILKSLKRLRTDVPHVQIAVQARQQQSNSEAEHQSDDSKPFVKL